MGFRPGVDGVVVDWSQKGVYPTSGYAGGELWGRVPGNSLFSAQSRTARIHHVGFMECAEGGGDVAQGAQSMGTGEDSGCREGAVSGRQLRRCRAPY